MRQCIFCPNKAKSREHLWPKWLLERIKPGRIEGFIGHNKDLSFHAEWKVRSVCDACNHGWMSRMEATISPIIGPLIDDKSQFIDAPQQWSISAWAVKTAMVLDSAVSSALPLFYTQKECDDLKESSTIPFRTTVSLARFLGDGDIGASNSEIKVGDPKLGRFPARITTFLLNCLVIQVFTLHPTRIYGDRPILVGSTEGPWDHLIVPCWPTSGRRIYWPPPLAMDFSRTVLDFRTFADRFNLGREVPIPPKRSSG